MLTIVDGREGDVSVGNLNTIGSRITFYSTNEMSLDIVRS